MLVSCIMPTYNRRSFVPRAIELFLGQTYAEKELIVLDDGDDRVADIIPARNDIRYIALPSRLNVGAKRNLACREARGDLILHWDDDDWYAPRRIETQVKALVESQADIAGLDRLLYFDPAANLAWQYSYPRNAKRWAGGNTLCYRKAFWNSHRFPEVMIGEDSRFVWSASAGKLVTIDDESLVVGFIHGSNVSPKEVRGERWKPYPIDAIQRIMNRPRLSPTALIAASRGIGDILRVTPLVRVFHGLGYAVDLLLAPDYPEVRKLLEGAPEIRRILSEPREAASSYDRAAFTYWSASARALATAEKSWTFDRNEWLREGDSRSIERIAREAGWSGPIPAPFARHSGRSFDLPPDAVALHPGCKPDWPWKKWHGFPELAAQLRNVVLIGAASDEENTHTYFREPFHWPPHARNYIGQLDLADTAALISQCRALVSNDSGIMHLGVALGVPVLGVFGITSPERECIPAPNMFPVTKGLACEPACRREAWGRRDCRHHLECLKTLTPAEVIGKLNQAAPPMAIAGARETRDAPPMETVSLVYYGTVFDTSGYGNAARAYIHALHAAGIEMAVVDLAPHPRQVRDTLVESLTGRKIVPDFHLFHGVPPSWARPAFSLPNAIGMTVWETDTMPSQWRNVLNHVLEVWLPCEFNVETFARDLRSPVFKLPHPLLTRENGVEAHAALPPGAPADAFVFYSIFEWQDRKSPMETMLAFLRAFSDENGAALILKTNPGAAQIARQAVEEARRRVGSRARIALYAESWTDAQIDALHARGDCYVSLHRGEGWNYPLFEAATRGNPVIATAYSGPMEYLTAPAHHLVNYQMTPVRQQYAFYNARMRWAEPDVEQAAQAMRSVYGNREQARQQAQALAPALRERYAPESIGAMARARLMELLKRTQPAKWERLQQAARPDRPPAPVPGDWYDAGYFENGVKSNWRDGYHWRHFGGLFREAAGFLIDMFPDARSFLDAGCAKGFLVRALRERERECSGFDISRWAIAHAEALAQPHVQVAGVDEFRFDRQFDLLVAFDLFAHLTEAQASDFLQRARKFTRYGLLATIHTQDPASPPAADPDDRDLSRVTLQTRSWWQQLFLSSGWRQDPLHRIAERACQAHPLPSRMGWQIYLYAPE
jgi:2-polyprenyl-3-methyl-5-hydroxy-6-metoxy-1,4-benzoquinol methylase